MAGRTWLGCNGKVAWVQWTCELPLVSEDRVEEPRNVAAQGGVVGGMTVLSRISGLVRDILLSHILGAGVAADVFFLAFRIPNFFRRVFAEGAFAQAFVPVLAEYRERRDAGAGGSEAALRAFVAAMAGNLGAALLVTVVAGVAGAWALVAVFMPGYLGEPAQFALAVDLTRIMFPYIGFISLVAFAGALLNSANRYAVPAFTPVLLNVSLITAALLVAVDSTPTVTGAAYALAWGVLAAGLAQLVFQMPSLARTGLLVWPKPTWRHEGARKVGVLLIPAVIAASAGQINVLVGSVLASLLETGSVSWLFYSDRLMELPIGIVAVALGTVLITNLSRLHRKGATAAFSELLDWGMRVGLLLGVPAAAALVVLGFPLVATIFLHGEFGVRDADMTTVALVAYALGLVPLVLVKIAQPGYFACQDTRTPLKFTVVSISVNVVVSLATFRWLGFLGLALATSAAAYVNAGLLLRGLATDGRYRPGRRLARVVLVTLAGTAAMSAVLWLTTPDRAAWLAAGQLARIGWLAALVAGGLVVYLVSVLALGIRMRDLRHRA